MLSGALERRVWINRGYYNLYPNLYVIIVGRSGIIKKSTSTGIAMKLLRDLKQIKMVSEMATAGSLVEQIGWARKQFGYGGKKIIQTPVFVYASELVVFMKEVFGSVVELLTTFYDCPEKWSYKTKHQGEVVIENLCFNMLGASTIEWLFSSVSVHQMRAGFGGRCVFVVQNDPPSRWVAWPTPDKNNKLLRQLLLEDLVRIYRMAGEFRVDDTFKTTYSEWYDSQMSMAVSQKFNQNMSGWYGRKGEMLLKLCMVRAASLGRHLLNVDHFEWARMMMDDIENNMQSIYKNYSPLIAAGGTFSYARDSVEAQREVDAKVEGTTGKASQNHQEEGTLVLMPWDHRRVQSLTLEKILRPESLPFVVPQDGDEFLENLGVCETDHEEISPLPVLGNKKPKKPKEPEIESPAS